MHGYNFCIKKVLPCDVEVLRELSIASFRETYDAHNTKVDMELHNDKHFNLRQLLGEIEDKGNWFFIAEVDNIPAGYIKLRTSERPASLQGLKHIELERIYALKRFQGAGLGKLLLHKCIDTGIKNGYEVLWLGVWKQNEKAIAFYTKQGFTIFGEHTFILGQDQQSDWLMKKALNP